MSEAADEAVEAALRRAGYISFDTVVRVSSRSKSTVSEHCASGKIKSVKVGARRFLLWEDVFMWLTSGDAVVAAALGIKKDELP